jgi:hypothetical protein
MRGSDLLNQIAECKRSQEPTVRYILDQDDLIGSKLATCGSWLHLREWVECGGETRLRNAKFCKQFRLCRACARRRAGRLIESYLPKIEATLAAAIAESKPLIPVMFSLTVVTGPDLGERIGHLHGSTRKMIAARRRAKSDSGRHLEVEWNKVAGSIRSTEIKLGRGGFWQPHVHGLALLTDYLDQAKFSAEWLKFTGDSFIVGVTQLRGDLVASLCEVIKYAVKFGDLTPEQLWHVHREARGTRLFESHGCLRGVPVPDIDQDAVDGLSGPYRDWLARWLVRERKFALEAYSARESVREELALVPG